MNSWNKINIRELNVLTFVVMDYSSETSKKINFRMPEDSFNNISSFIADKNQLKQKFRYNFLRSALKVNMIFDCRLAGRYTSSKNLETSVTRKIVPKHCTPSFASTKQAKFCTQVRIFIS